MSGLSEAESRWLEQGRTWPDRLQAWAIAGAGVEPVADHDSADHDPRIAEFGAAWRAAIDPEGFGAWAERLQRAGLTPGDIGALLPAVDRAPPHADDPPPWWATFTRLRSACKQAAKLQSSSPISDADRDFAALVDAVSSEAADVAFAHLLAPMVATSWQRLCTQCPAARALPESAAADARRALLQRLSEIGSSALGADFSDTRRAGATIMLAIGASPDTPGTSTNRYLTWCHDHLTDGCAHLWNRFPVLCRLLATVCDQWRMNLTDMLERVAADRTELAQHFGIAQSSVLSHIEWGLSDPHRGGRTVSVLHFSASADDPAVHPEPGVSAGDPDPAARVTRIVYKPKDLRIEQRFQDVLDLVGDWLQDDSWRAQTIHAVSDTYGYAEFLPATPCQNDAQLSVFYRNAGRLLAVLHLLGASDAHCENLIACGTMLHLIDAETLFESPRNDSGDDPAPSLMAESVLRVGMLPGWSVSGKAQRIFDVSALGVDSTTTEPRQLPGWRWPNTDDMVRSVITAPPSQPTSLPVPAGSDNPLAEHRADVEAGFVEVYRAAMDPDRQAALCTAIEAFRGVRRRIVLRATRVYAIVAEQAATADALTDVTRRAVALEQLARSALLAPPGHWTWEVFGAELLDLDNLDIPYFDVSLGSATIDSAAGPIAGVLNGDADSLTTAQQRVAELSEADLAWQCRLIRGSIRSRYVRMSGGQQLGPARVDAPPAYDPEQVVQTVFDAISAGAIDNGRGNFTWLTLSLLPDGDRVLLSLVGDSLYDGRIGIAAFQDMVRATGPRNLTEVTLRPVWERADASESSARHRFVRNLGIGWTGLGGLLRLWDVPAFARLCDTAVAALTPNHIAGDRTFDLLGGVAGLIGPLARRQRHHPDAHTAHLLRLAAQHLAAAQFADGGWPFREASGPLTGLSHGASGMGMAMIEAGVALDDADFIAAGVRAFDFERAHFDEARGNWPDFRHHALGPDGQPTAMVAWCHGAPGIGLARLQALTLLPDHPDAEVWRSELDVAMTTTLTSPLGTLDHLCCGNLGRAAVLQIAGSAMAQQQWLHAADTITAEVLARAMADGRFRFPYDDPDTTGAQSPGFMNGLAGVGAHVWASSRAGHLGAILM